MKYTYDNEVFEIGVSDDGTLDTLVIVNGKEYRFTENERSPDGSLTEDTITQAIEAYLDDREAGTL
jgi:hypothetical protein